MNIKEICKEYALQIKQNTGKFPTSDKWSLKAGYPCGLTTLKKQFNNSYNEFRDYCNEPRLLRTEKLTIDWLKNNCEIDENQCWNWLKALTLEGYGQCGYNSKNYSTHRLSYELVNGLIPDGLLVRHKCNNRKCCNPAHLELGTQQDNSLDTVITKISYLPKNNNAIASITRRMPLLEERLDFYLTNIQNDNGCWYSTLLKVNENGYHQIFFKNKTYKLHRALLARKLNKEYKDVDITRHICNNKSCINPDHLIEGDHSSNASDSRTYSKNTKLTKENVIEIRTNLLTYDTTKRGNKVKFDKLFSSKFNVSERTITCVRENKTWKDIVVI